MVMLTSAYLCDFIDISPIEQNCLEITFARHPVTDTPIVTLTPLFRLSIDETQHPIWRIDLLQQASESLNVQHQIRGLLRQLIEQPICTESYQNFYQLLVDLTHHSQRWASFRVHPIHAPYLIPQAHHHPLYAILTKLQSYLYNDFTHSQILAWYFIRYQQFNSRRYYLFQQSVKPFLPHLQRWEREHPNRLAWFLLSQDLTHVSSLSFFRYQDFVQFSFQDARLFSSQKQVQRFFALPPKKFQYILMLLFHTDIRQTEFAKMLLEAYLRYPLPMLTQLQLWKMRVIFPPETVLNPTYLKQYAHAFYLIFQVLQQSSTNEQQLHEFLFGIQIRNGIYTEQPNIALIHSKMTCKSLIHHSKKWQHAQQRIESTQLKFNFKDFKYDIQECRFELICNCEQLMHEAQSMQHCILTYAQRIAQHQYLCFRVYHHDMRATLGLVINPHYQGYEFHQCVGVRNQTVPTVIEQLAQQFNAYLNQCKISFAHHIS